jgi:flagellar FliJ protein
MNSLLNLREQLEKDTKNRMAVAMSKLRDEQEKLEHILLEKDAVAEELNRSSSAGITVGNIRRFNAYISHLREKAYTQEDVVKQRTKYADKIREELIKAMQEKKILKKLRERQYAEFLKTVSRKEQVAVDELISYKNAGRSQLEPVSD